LRIFASVRGELSAVREGGSERDNGGSGNGEGGGGGWDKEPLFPVIESSRDEGEEDESGGWGVKGRGAQGAAWEEEEGEEICEDSGDWGDVWEEGWDLYSAVANGQVGHDSFVCVT